MYYSGCDRKLFNLLQVVTFIYENNFRRKRCSHDLHKQEIGAFKTRKREYFLFHRRTDFQLSESQVYSQMFRLETSYLFDVCYQYVSISIKERKTDGSMRRGSLRNRGVQKVITNCAGPEVLTAVVL
jgi:hypothetical protein